MEQAPKYLFRYRSISGVSAEYLRRTLLEEELYFAKPSAFNDPFDCLPSFVFEATEVEVITYYQNAIRRRNPQFSDDQVLIEALAKRYGECSPRDSGLLQRAQKHHAQRVKERIGILCMSETPTEILMWSHYADFHRGVCLQFDSQSPVFANIHQVKYLADRPRINPFRDDIEQMMEAVLLAKAQHWFYEKEWRLIQYRGGPKAYKFPREALVGVVLGACITSADEQLILSWIKERKTPTEVRRATVSETAFELHIE